MRIDCLQLLFCIHAYMISKSRISLGELLASLPLMKVLFFKNMSQGFLISNFKKTPFSYPYKCKSNKITPQLLGF